MNPSILDLGQAQILHPCRSQQGTSKRSWSAAESIRLAMDELKEEPPVRRPCPLDEMLEFADPPESDFIWWPLVAVETHEVVASEQWSAARVTALQGEGRAVFVNFTAAWCVTCTVNEVTAFTPRVAGAMADTNTAYLVGDWTSRDGDIAAALAEHGRAGVPLSLYYPADGGPPRVLPQVLTESLVLQTVEGR